MSLFFQSSSSVRSCSLLLVSSVILFLSGCQEQQSDTHNNAAPQSAKPVVAISVKPQNLPLQTTLSGRLSALLSAEIRPQVGGIVKKRLFKEGSNVKAGQVLYQIDDATYQAAYEQAQGDLQQAEAQLQAAKTKADRYSKLVKIKAVSQQDYDDAKASVMQYQGVVKTDDAAVQTAFIDLQRCEIKSPISGWIGSSSVTAGALVEDEQSTALATVYNYDHMYLDVTRSSDEWLALRQAIARGELKDKKQAKVTITLADGSKYPEDGTLLFSGIDVDATTGSITLRIKIPNKNHLLLPGMYAKATLDDALSEGVYLVPQLAVQRDTDGNATLWLDVNGKAHKVAVQVERSYKNMWVINKGISAGDKVITEGFSNLAEGMPVTVSQAHKGA
ncbi:efflux RND transporter periplasmic adaptor subunit [Celerinatantimonas sp. MCCC 1A17872]|uniref:efflux RND transporter periplasmic adaptor subunit n=1 Tax=Celerinatantimonas sp. MCCC 1A17872 TaxID=3177514 RepID=UPI0038C4094F